MPSPTHFAILGLATWLIVTVLGVAGFRLYRTLASGKPANTFRADGADLPGLGERLVRVHANCVENIPLYIAVMLFAMASGQTAITDAGAGMLLYARVAQSIVHAASTSVPAVLLRFSFYALQTGLILWWLWQMISA